MHANSFPAIATVTLLALVACSPPAPPTALPGDPTSAVVRRHAELVHASYAAAHEAASVLARACKELASAPSAATLSAARNAWSAARGAYAPTEAFRFYGGPIDVAERGPEGLINAWPIDERYIESGDRGHPGLVESEDAIDAARLVALNEAGGESNIATGFHAIEFLLWGVDRRVDGPGDRSFEDFLPPSPVGIRRGRYVAVASALVVEHLAGLAAAWAPDVSGNYRAAFEARGSDALRDLLRGLAMLGGDELAGERIAVALAQRDQEHEQSCFSDTTLADHAGNARGIAVAYRGAAGATGPWPADLVRARDPALAARVDAAIDRALRAIEDVPGPFDQAIVQDTGRAALERAIAALEAQTGLIVEAARCLGLDLGIAAGSDGRDPASGSR